MTNTEVEAFIGAFRSLMLASLTPEGEPYASTAPFVIYGGDFYVLLSTVAQHGKNLLHHSEVSLLLTEDESEMIQPFARKRVTVKAASSIAEKDNPVYADVLAQMSQKFDAGLIEMLSSMGDFYLFRLKPTSGSAVWGFGKAFHLNEKLEIEGQIVGHHQKKGNHG